MLDFKKVSFILIPYLTFCASFFHIAFWDTFNINGLSIISLTDILKTCIYPIFTIPLTYLYQILLFNFSISFDAKKKWSQIQIISFFVVAKFILDLTLYLTKQTDEPYRYICYCILFSFFISLFLTNSNFLINYFESPKFRLTFIQLLVFLPIVTFCSGKYQGLILKTNNKYKYTIISTGKDSTQNFKNDTLKLLGLSDEQYLFSDLKNSKIILFRKNIFDTLILYDKK